MKLHELPNGSFIDLSTITAIRPLSAGVGEGETIHPSRTVIHHAAGIEIIEFETDVESGLFSRDLAEKANRITAWKALNQPK